MSFNRDIAVQADEVGKQYQLGQLDSGYEMLSEVISQRLRGIRSPRNDDRSFWALRDVGFEVERGESFGIIGHNGAGKSTLLKILSRVTPPTTGQIRLRGRVGALLEVGTGFHPELTGRENVFLNGAILGMGRDEIASKFDEIVAFAEVERFIDTPVKRYSSGMYLRLAFAVAAHLEPEILIVDEVLSVGDMAFQEKCLGRMSAVAGEGRTVLFVSHNLAAVQRLCPRSLLLEHGGVVKIGPTREVIDAYVETLGREARTSVAERTDREGSGRLRFTSVSYFADGRPVDMPLSGENLEIALGYETEGGRPTSNVTFSASVYTTLGELILHFQSDMTGGMFGEMPARGEVRCRIPRLPLPGGRYWINIHAAAGGETLDWIQRAADLTVGEGDFYGTGRTAADSHRTVLVEQEWALSAR